MAEVSRVHAYKRRFDDGAAKKRLWYPMFQLVGEYVMCRKQNFEVTTQPGEFLTEQLFSNTAPNALVAMASAFVGNLWPNGARSIKIERPRNIPDTNENKQYYDELTNRLVDVLDAPETGLVVAVMEYMLDQGSFGISGVKRRRTGDLTDPLRITALNVKNFVVEENKDGVVDTIFIDEDLTARIVVERYGVKNVSLRVQEAFKKGDIKTTFKVVQVIEPRTLVRPGAKGNQTYPYVSFHFEYASGKILRDSGFKRMPVTIARFQKALGEIYGRSPAMAAMPAILRLNLVWELLMRTGEKKLRPPLYMIDNGSLGSDMIDTSPDAINVFQPVGVGDSNPIGPLYDAGQLQDIYPIVEQLMKDVTQAFFIDRLMDLNSDTRMTLGEAQMRDRIRGDGMAGGFKRQEAEFFSPLVQGCLEDLMDEGLLGVIPGSDKERKILDAGLEPLYIPSDVIRAIERGQKVYTIKYISPAARIMRTEEMQGLVQMLDVTLGSAPAIPTIIDGLNVDNILKKLRDLSGQDEELINSLETIQSIRQARDQMQQQMMQAEQVQQAADAGMKIAQAQSMREGAISGRPRG